MLSPLLLLLAGSLPCYAQFPNLLWSSNLLGKSSISSGGIRKGNGVVLSKNQENLWVTDAAGSIHLIRLEEQRDHVTFTPESLPNRLVESRSMASLFENATLTFVVYNVIDVPNGQAETIESRVICVNEDNALIWEAPVGGVAVGNPQISSDGKFVFVIHNLPNGGVATILNVQDSGKILLQLPGNFLSPFGPPVLVSVDGVDFIYWGESTNEGYADAGRTFHMRVEEPFSIVADFLFDSSTVVQPTVSSDGSTMWLGGKEASIYSWKLLGDQGRLWKQQLAQSRRNVTFPLVNTIEVSRSKLFISSASNSFHCLDANHGNILWSTSLGPSVYLTSAKASPRDDFVYSIQHLTGKVVQQDAWTGDVMWYYDCKNVTGSLTCMDSVEAESSLSSDGSTLYYGDIYGTIYALAVSEAPPTVEPTNTPTDQPTIYQSSLPSYVSSMTPTSTPSLDPSLFPTEAPSATHSIAPSEVHSIMPSRANSGMPSELPSFMPSAQTEIPSTSFPSISIKEEVPKQTERARGPTSSAKRPYVSGAVILIASMFAF